MNSYRPSYFKTCLVRHVFSGDQSTFSFNLRNQINTDILYDEVKINYIAYNTNTPNNMTTNIYVQEFQQYLGSVYDGNRLWTASSYSINLEGRPVPQSLTFKMIGNYTNEPLNPEYNDDIAIMLTFIKH